MLMRKCPRHALAWAVAVLLAACRSTTGVCGPSSKAAMVLSAYDGGLNNPVHTVTIVYDKHGDDSLTILRDLSTAVSVKLGNAPGIYDFRVMAPGYADYLMTNEVIRADGCDPVTVGTQGFMQKLP
jgi:hypothetical protein